MCCYFTHYRGKPERSDPFGSNTSGQMFCYKLVTSNRKSLYRIDDESLTYSEGNVIQSNRKSARLTTMEKIDGRVSKGIHVFTRLSQASHIAGFVNSQDDCVKIIKVLCKDEDYVCFDLCRDEAVFSQVTVVD